MKRISRAHPALFALIILALALSACGGAPSTLDADAIATSAAMTVEARFTDLAAQATSTFTPEPTATLIPPTVIDLPTIPPMIPTQTPGVVIGTPVLPCLSATWLYDVSIPDGMILEPGAAFTKTWRVKNTGTCPWDQGYALSFHSGDAMGTKHTFPLAQIVNPNQEVDISIDLTAPVTEGSYSGYWRLATPFGGTIGFSIYDSPLSVKIQSAKKGKFSVADVSYTYTRDPIKGCSDKGAVYAFAATITVNAPGEVFYHWERSPMGEDPLPFGTLTFTAAGSKTVYYEWLIKADKPQDIPRWVAIYIDAPNKQQFDRVMFDFTCQ